MTRAMAHILDVRQRHDLMAPDAILVSKHGIDKPHVYVLGPFKTRPHAHAPPVALHISQTTFQINPILLLAFATAAVHRLHVLLMDLERDAETIQRVGDTRDTCWMFDSNRKGRSYGHRGSTPATECW